MTLRPIASMSALVLAAALLIPNTAIAQGTVTISTGEWAPFLSEKMPHGGIATRIVTAAFAAVGINVEYRWYGEFWERAKQDALHAEVDFSAVWYHTEARARLFAFTDPVIDVATVFFYHKDAPFDWHSLETIDVRKTIGVTRGYSYSEQFDVAKEAGWFRHEVADRDVLNFRKLLRRRIDAFVIGELVGHDILKQSFSPSHRAALAVHPRKISEAPMFLITSKDNPRALPLLKRFNEGLRILRDSGGHEAIMREYR